MPREAKSSETAFRRRRIRLNSLSSWWYCACALSVDGYLLYRAVNLCCRYNELPWRQGEDRPVFELYAYIALIAANVMCLPFIVVFSLFQVGNYANDGLRLGRDDTRAERLVVRVTEAGEEVAVPERADMDLGSTWRHVGPLAQGLHVLAAFLLLLPQMLVQAQEIKYEFLPSDAVWWSDLDPFLNHHDDNRYHDANSPQSTNASSIYPPDPSSATVASVDHLAVDVMSISFRLHPEFLNYCFALFVYSVRYASVFWYTEALFCLLFSTQLLLTAVYFALSFCATSVLYKILVNPEIITSAEDGSATHGFMLSSVLLLGLSLVANFVVSLSPIVIFNFGFLHYRRSWKRFLRRGNPTTVRFCDDVENAIPMETCCHGYTQHVLATVYLLAMVGLRLPVVFDYVTVYKATGSTAILIGLLADVVVLLVWVFLWFVFTVRQKWNFKVMLTKESFQNVAAFTSRPVANHRELTDGMTEHVTDESTSYPHCLVEDGTNHQSPGDIRCCNQNECSCHGGAKTMPDVARHKPVECASDRDARKRRRGETSDPANSSRGRSLPGVFCGCTSSRRREAQTDETLPNLDTNATTHPIVNTRELSPPDAQRKEKCKPNHRHQLMMSSSFSELPGNIASEVERRHLEAAIRSATKCNHDSDVSCRGAKRRLEEPEDRVVDISAPSDHSISAPDNTLTHCYRWNVRHKCGQYFHGNCQKDKSEKPFRKRPPAPFPPPQSSSIPSAATSCELATDKVSPPEATSTQDSSMPSRHSEIVCVHRPPSTVSHPTAVATTADASVVSVPTNQASRSKEDTGVKWQSTAQLNLPESSTIQDGQSLSKSANALDDATLRRSADRTRTRIADGRPHSSCIFTSDNNYNRLTKDHSHDLQLCNSRPIVSLLPPSPSLHSFTTSDCLLLNCKYIGSHSAIPLQFPPPPLPPPAAAPPPPPIQKLSEFKGLVVPRVVTIDVSSTDSTNSQTLCSQV